MSAPKRDLDRLLQGLRRHCGTDAYRLVPVGPDRWNEIQPAPAHWGVRGDGWPTPDARLISGGPDHPIARCPLHPSAGYSLVIKEKYHGAKASVWCRVGCDEVALRHVLIEDAEGANAAPVPAPRCSSGLRAGAEGGSMSPPDVSPEADARTAS